MIKSVTGLLQTSVIILGLYEVCLPSHLLEMVWILVFEDIDRIFLDLNLD